MAEKEDHLKLERDLYARLPRTLMKAWIVGEKADAYRFLAEGTDPVAIHRAQGRVLLLERMNKLLDQYNAQ